jgi:toxin ParE1/3/4
VKRREVTFLPHAEADLIGLYGYIAEESGHDVAGGYVERIQAACTALETFPERGTRRDEIRPGLRTMGFERRATIVFQVMKAEVVIVRISYGGQDYERALRAMTDK